MIFGIRTKYDNNFSIQEMEEMEIQLKCSVLTQDERLVKCSDAIALCKELKLQVEYEENMGDDEAKLVHSADEQYNGKIILIKDLKSFKFACVHEIIHYIFDVGYGKKVPIGACYPRKRKGKTTDIAEQKTNYLTAAYTMPYREMLDEIERFDTSSPKMDIQIFLRNLSDKYQQSKVAVVRRIREVRRLSKAQVKI